MLTRLVLRNFQRHRKLEIDLDRITTLTGPSDRGKSSVLRAIRLVCRNLPAGTGFIQHGRDRCLAQVVAEGRKITRKKGKENSYRVDGEKPLKVITQGPRGIPTSVQNVLRTEDINFALQHDPPFWFTESPGQVSKNLNRIVNLDVIDAVLAKAQQRVRKTQAVAEVTADRVKEAEATVKKLEWVEAFGKKLAVLTILAQKVEAETDRCHRLEELLAKYDAAAAESDRLKDAAEAGLNVVAVGAKVVDLTNSCSRLVALLKAHKAERRAAKIKLVGWEELEETRAAADNVAERCRRLEYLVEQLEQAEESACQLRSEEKKLLEKLGNRCPACLRPLKSSPSLRRTCTSPKRHR